MKYAYRGNMDSTFMTNKKEDLQSLWLELTRRSYPSDPKLKPTILRQIQSYTLSDWDKMMKAHTEYCKMVELRKAGQSYIFRPSMPPLEFPAVIGFHSFKILHDPSILPSKIVDGIRVFDVSSCQINSDES